MGIDIGSSMTKIAVMREKEIVRTFLLSTGFSSRLTADRIPELLASEGIDAADCDIAATGYGRVSVPYAQRTVTEITCHAKGAEYLFRQDGTVVDIGGQAPKAICLKNGRVMKFMSNDKCSAGTGKFLEIMANRMGVTIEELALLAEKGDPVTISSMCTVFAESEVISLIGQGTPRESIANGIVESVVTKVSSLAQQVPSEKYFLTGGLCEIPYMVKCLSGRLNAPVLTVPQARYAGAIGAALLACGK